MEKNKFKPQGMKPGGFKIEIIENVYGLTARFMQQTQIINVFSFLLFYENLTEYPVIYGGDECGEGVTGNFSDYKDTRNNT